MNDDQPEPGDKCPFCKIGTVHVRSSPVIGQTRIQYLGCTSKCGFKGKRTMPLSEAPRNPNRQRKPYIRRPKND